MVSALSEVTGDVTRQLQRQAGDAITKYIIDHGACAVGPLITVVRDRTMTMADPLCDEVEFTVNSFILALGNATEADRVAFNRLMQPSNPTRSSHDDLVLGARDYRFEGGPWDGQVRAAAGQRNYRVPVVRALTVMAADEPPMASSFMEYCEYRLDADGVYRT